MKRHQFAKAGLGEHETHFDGACLQVRPDAHAVVLDGGPSVYDAMVMVQVKNKLFSSFFG
jgi:hypothetical protein